MEKQMALNNLEHSVTPYLKSKENMYRSVDKKG